MQSHRGSCHCGAIAFELQSDFKDIIECNCSICRKKGSLNLRVAAGQFSLLTGAAQLQLYQFNTEVAHHYFCKHCGIHPFSRPRSAPDKYAVNLRCIDGIDANAYSTIKFDGQNWEQAMAAINLGDGQQ